jgi:hypothetical protein
MDEILNVEPALLCQNFFLSWFTGCITVSVTHIIGTVGIDQVVNENLGSLPFLVVTCPLESEINRQCVCGSRIFIESMM